MTTKLNKQQQPHTEAHRIRHPAPRAQADVEAHMPRLIRNAEQAEDVPVPRDVEANGFETPAPSVEPDVEAHRPRPPCAPLDDHSDVQAHGIVRF